ncbi:acyl-CoA dehydrogenase family protein [Gordonia humi]|uniref:acyl-CoA dehydrogenase family protein n=1 Tax=Gordonia humi TaxID=686429 RepID=UPI00360BE687
MRVSGTVTHVLGAADAGTILVPADHDGRTALILVAADTDGVTVRRRTSIDLTRPTSDMRFDAVYGEILAHGDDASRILRSSLETAAALLAAEQVGLCEWALDTSVDYLKARYQFGQPIGSNQALRHRTAQLWIDVNHARAAAVYAASTRASGSDDAATALAQAHCSETALHLVESAIQIHGGVGFAWEHPLHLYLKRAFADSVLLGDSQTHRRALAGFIDIAAPHAESSR